MARNGSGTFILPPSNPVVSGTVIESDWANDTMADLAAGLTQSIAYDGQTIPIANLPMGGFHHTNVSSPSQRNQYATLGMVQDSMHIRVQIVSGVDNLVGTLVGGATSYVAGALVSFFAPANNTGPMTLNYNGIGARSIVSANGLPLGPNAIVSGAFVMAYYDGAQFKLISAAASTVAVALLTLATTGQERPGGGAYAPMTIATGTSINVPAGTAWIVPPDSDSPEDAIEVSWANQSVTLSFLFTSFTTTIAVNSFGQIVQFAGRAIGANLRDCAVLGVVEHMTGVANKVITKPTIFADDNYRITDVSSLLTNTIINGGLVTPNAVSLLQLDISAGSIFMPGGDANTINSPNVYAIPQQANIQFRPMAGQNTLSAVVANAPITQYDPNGAGVVTTIPGNNDTVVHRLYFLYGSYIWVYGQKIYNDVENAMSLLEWDRTQYKPSIFLMDATLVAEIVAIKNTTSLVNPLQCKIVAPGGLNFSIGSPGGISEAPIDGTPYGRQDAAWVQVLRRTAPQAITSLTVTGSPNTVVAQVLSPVAAGTVSWRTISGLNQWYSMDTVNPDDSTYFRSWNPANGALRFTTRYDLASGSWSFPTTMFFTGAQARIFGDLSNATPTNRLLFGPNAANGNGSVGVTPSGTATNANWTAYGGSNPDNAAFVQFGVTATTAEITSSNTNPVNAGRAMTVNVYPGSGSTTPTERIRFPSSQNRMQILCTGNPIDRFFFQSNQPAVSTVLGVLPGVGTADSAINLNAQVDPANTFMINVGTDAVNGWTYISSSATGTGTFRPIVFWTSGGEAMRIAAGTRNVAIGTTDTSLAKLFVNGTLYTAGDVLFGRTGVPGAEGGQANWAAKDGVSTGFFIDVDGGNAVRMYNALGTKVGIFTNNGEHFVVNGGPGNIDIINGDASFGGIVNLVCQANSVKRTLRVATGTGDLELVNNGFSTVTHRFNDSGTTVVQSTVATFGDNVGNLGSGAQRWGTVFAVNPAIVTSDEREKTPLTPFTDAELAAAKELATKISTYKWLDAVEKKGEDARTHIGLGAQTVMAVMTKHGLEPFKYGFVCYDEWEAEAPEIYEVEDEEGNKTGELRKVTPGREAGNRYSVRYDQLALFIARGQEQRLAAIEAKLERYAL